MKSMLNCLTALVVALLLSITSPVLASSSNKALGQVQFSANVSTNKDERGLFTTDFIIPLYYSLHKDTLVFFNPKDTYTEPTANEYHLGGGVRHIVNDSFILGLNTFFDRRQTNSNLWFSQAGVGLEYLSQPLDIRLNWYKPTTSAKDAPTTYGFGSSGLIQYDSRVEPLQGLDLEAGIPVFENQIKTRAYLGGYFYQSRLGKDVNGFRARTETKITRWLSVDTTYNSNIAKKMEFFGGLRATLAFDMTNLFGHKGLKKFFSTPSMPESNNTYLEDRLFDRVVRDIDIQSTSATSSSTAHDLIYVDNTNAGVEDGTREHPYNTVQEGVDAAAGGKWVFVEGSGLSNYASDITLTDAVTLWGSGYNGGFRGLSVSGVYPVLNAGTTGVTLDNHNTVMGLKIQNTSADGILFTSNTTLTATIDHNIITGAGAAGINFSGNTGDMSNLVITHNTITDSVGNGIDLTSNNATMTGVDIENNTLNDNGSAGVSFAFNNGTNTISHLTIANNTSNNNSASGLDLSSNYGTMAHVVISGNTSVNNGGDGLTLSNNGNGSGVMSTLSDFSILNNNFAGNSGEGINAAGNGFAAGNGTITGFTISNNNLSNNLIGLNFSFNGQSGNGIISNILISNNTVNGITADSAITFSNNANGGTGSISGITIKNNTVLNAAYNGIDFSYNAYLGSGTISDVTISNNTTKNSGVAGISFAYNAHNNTGSISNVTIVGNTSTNNYSDGIDLSYNGDDGAGSGTLSYFTISRNTLNSNGNAGLNMTMNGYQGNVGTIEHFTISNNTINSNGNDGIDMTYNGYQGTGIISDVTISNNTVNNNAFDGFELSHNGDSGTGTMSGFKILDNSFNSNYIGLDLRYNANSGTGTVTDFTLSRNSFNQNNYDGMVLSFNEATVSDWTFTRNTFVSNAAIGMLISKSTGMTNFNFGNGTSGGYNSFYGNGSNDLSNNNDDALLINLPAQYNWWGQAGGPIADQIFAGGYSVNTAHSLSKSP